HARGQPRRVRLRRRRPHGRLRAVPDLPARAGGRAVRGAAGARGGTGPRRSPPAAASAVAARIGRLDWEGIERSLDERGWAKTGSPVLGPRECLDLIALY